MLKLPTWLGLTFTLLCFGFYVVFIGNIILWLIFSLCHGELAWSLFYSGFLSCSKFILISVVEHLGVCGQWAACKDPNALAYTYWFFSALSMHFNIVCFHVLFALFMAFSVFYFAGIFLSLAKRLQTPRFAHLPTVCALLLLYVIVIFVLGLRWMDPSQSLWFLLIMSIAFPLVAVIGWYVSFRAL